MATTLELKHTFPCSPERLYELVSDTNFDEGLLDAIEVDSTVLEEKKTQDGRVLRYKFCPRRGVPTGLKRVLGKSMEWTEERAWSASYGGHTWTIKPGMGGSRAAISGSYQIVPGPDGTAERIIQGRFEISAPLLGRTIERFLVAQTTDAFERGAQYIQAHLEASA